MRKKTGLRSEHEQGIITVLKGLHHGMAMVIEIIL
jgi:hypothetical protein